MILVNGIIIVIRESAAKSRVFDLATFSAKIESEPYDNRPYEQRYWENCSLRIFLNTTFYNEAFTDTEKVIITDYVTTNYTGKNQYGESVDKVSLLNDYKVKEYFLGVSALAKEETNNAKALITPYALSKSDNELDNKNGYGRYWLRDLNMTGSVESLNPNGRVTPVSRDYKQYKKVGVRPIVQVVY